MPRSRIKSRPEVRVGCLDNALRIASELGLIRAYLGLSPVALMRATQRGKVRTLGTHRASVIWRNIKTII